MENYLENYSQKIQCQRLSQQLHTMFAVPGWSISADTLKTQEHLAAKKLAHEATPKDQNGTTESSRKRKRGHGTANGVNVTEENLADLWRKHIERKSQVVEDGTGSTEKKKKKKRRKEKVLNEVEASAVESNVVDNRDQDPHRSQAEVGKSKGRKDVGSSFSAEAVKPEITTETVNGEAQNVDPTKASKTKFEDRKRRALEKKERKALLQANGTLPPPRPTNNQDALISSDSPRPAKPRGPLSKNVFSDKSHAATPRNIADIPIDNAKANHLPPHIRPKPPPQAPALTLTPLQQSMQSKLVSARFRHLNQTLYTTASTQASQLFTETPSAFSSYHAGFRAQVAIWPQNPVDTFIKDVKARAKVGSGRDSQQKLWRQERKGKGKGKTAADSEVATTDPKPIQELDPLPRTRGTCTIADLGCGDASLAAALSPLSKSLHLRLHSFDLAKGDGPNASLITVADISNLPLTDGSIDVAIFCLALMGTNWVNFVEEVGRVVRWGGECWVAEIRSRFGRPPVKGKRKQAKGKDEEEEVAEVEEDLAGKQGEKTDVSAFVEVWRRRGFELKGEVDTGNKMFVKMRFVKKLTPTKGKGVPKDSALLHGKDEERGIGKFKGKKRFLDNSREDDVDEAKVLKPCVYKTR